jgi:molybdate transport system substrate-binding protein
MRLVISKNNAYFAVFSIAASIFTATLSFAADIRVFSGGAPREVLSALTPEFEKLTGHKVQFTYLVVSAMQQRLAAGEKPDMVIVSVSALDPLIKAGTLRPESRSILGSVGIAMGVRQGAASPDISTPDKLRAVLLGARSVVHSNPKDTPSGAQMARVTEQLGIVEAMQRKTVHRNFLDGGADLITKGEADFGFYPQSAMMSVKGVAVAGMLPQSLDDVTIYSAAVMAANTSPEPAQAFIRFLADPANHKYWKEAGFGPPTGN